MGAGRPKLTWKKLTEKDCREWKLTTVDPQERSTWRSGVRSAMHAASQLPSRGPTDVDDVPARVRASDRHCRKMRRNNKFGAKNINLATTIGERKIASKFFYLASESSPPATSHCLVPLNGHQCVS